MVKYAFAAFVLALAVYYGHQGVKLWRAGHANAATAAQDASVATGELAWHTDLAPAMAESLRTGKPLVIDFWATWCKNCIAMDRTTFREGEVVAALDGFVRVKYQAEAPNADDTAPVLKHFEVLGLPTYLVLLPEPPGMKPGTR